MKNKFYQCDKEILDFRSLQNKCPICSHSFEKNISLPTCLFCSYFISRGTTTYINSLKPNRLMVIFERFNRSFFELQHDETYKYYEIPKGNLASYLNIFHKAEKGLWNDKDIPHPGWS